MIDDSGRVLFRAQIVDAAGVQFTGTQGYLSRGYFLGDSRGNLVKVLRGGDPEPSGSIPGATITTGGGAATLTSTPRIASNGLILFGTTFWDVVGLTVANANDTAIYVGTPGNWQILVREGSARSGLRRCDHQLGLQQPVSRPLVPQLGRTVSCSSRTSRERASWRPTTSPGSPVPSGTFS